MNPKIDTAALALPLQKDQIRFAITQATRSGAVSQDAAKILTGFLDYLVQLEDALKQLAIGCKELAADCDAMPGQTAREPVSRIGGSNNLRQP